MGKSHAAFQVTQTQGTPKGCIGGQWSTHMHAHRTHCIMFSWEVHHAHAVAKWLNYHADGVTVEILLWTIEHANSHSILQCNVLPVPGFIRHTILWQAKCCVEVLSDCWRASSSKRESLQSELNISNIFHDWWSDIWLLQKKSFLSHAGYCYWCSTAFILCLHCERLINC